MLCPPVPTMVEEHNTVRMDPEVEQTPLMAVRKIHVFSSTTSSASILPSPILVACWSSPRMRGLVLISMAIIAQHNTLPLFIFEGLHISQARPASGRSCVFCNYCLLLKYFGY